MVKKKRAKNSTSTRQFCHWIYEVLKFRTRGGVTTTGVASNVQLEVEKRGGQTGKGKPVGFPAPSSNFPWKKRVKVQRGSKKEDQLEQRPKEKENNVELPAKKIRGKRKDWGLTRWGTPGRLNTDWQKIHVKGKKKCRGEKTANPVGTGKEGGIRMVQKKGGPDNHH